MLLNTVLVANATTKHVILIFSKYCLCNYITRTINCMASQFVQHVASINSYLMVLRSWLCNTARTSKHDENEFSKLCKDVVHLWNSCFGCFRTK